MKKIRKFFFWLTVVLTTAVIVALTGLLVLAKWWPNDLSDRALVVVVEWNGILTEEDLEFYENNKEISDIFLTLFFGAKWSALKSMQITEVWDTVIDKAQADLIGHMANGYGKLVKLTEDEATPEKLAEVLRILDTQGYKVDLILSMHGNSEFILFQSEPITPMQIPLIVGDVNLGYVYQINCYSQSFADTWIKAGAKAVNGTEGVNVMSIIAPPVFLRSFIWGESFEKAVNRGFETELRIWEYAAKVIEGIPWTEPEAVEGSRPIITGNPNYNFAN